MIRRSALAAVLQAGSAWQAQAVQGLSGQWTGTTRSPTTGNELQIRLTITESTGTWRYIAPTSSNKAGPCFGREFPLTVQQLADAKVLVSVDGPSVIVGCPSFALTLERTDEQTLSGALRDGRSAVLKKQ